MIPVSLKLSGFLSYFEPAWLDFSLFDLACISGSNGAGKSSLLDAITWALFGQARRRDDAIINSHASAAEVVFDFAYEGNLYRIQRSKPRDKSTILEFFIQAPDGTWKPLTERSVRDTEERISRTLRLDYETFVNASFFLQGKADLFAQQRPGDRKRILSSILGLEVWEKYREIAAERRKVQEISLATLDNSLAEINTELGEEKERRARLKQLEENLGQLAKLRSASQSAVEGLRRLEASVQEQGRLVEMLQVQSTAARQRLEQVSMQVQARLEDRLRYQNELAAEAEARAAHQHWLEVRDKLAKWELLAADFRQFESKRLTPLLAIEKMQAALTQERTGLLALQSQSWEWTEQKEKITSDLTVLIDTLDEIRNRLQKRVSLETDLAALIDQRANFKAENDRLRLEMTQLKERISQLNEAEGATCPLCGQPLSHSDRLILITTLEMQGTEMGDRYRANQEQMRQSDQDRRTLDNELSLLRNLEQTELQANHKKVAALEDRKSQLEASLAAWETGSGIRLVEVERILSEADFAQGARQQLAEADRSLKELGYDTASHDADRQAELAGRASADAIRELENAKAALAPVEREIAGLEQQRAAAEQEASRQEATWRQANDKYQADLAALPDIAQAEQELYELREQESKLALQVGASRQQVEVLKTLRLRQQDLNQRREETSLSIARYKQLERAFSKDGVPALLIEQALPEIESQANEILSRLSAGDMSVRFATQKDYKDKSRDDKRETLDIMISDAAGVREYELFSGGEAFRVNFAIRLALSRVLALRAGARLQTLVIDEGFGSQDAEGRQRLIEAINLVRPDFAKVLVITHLEELKDAFPARVEVEKTSMGSRITVM